MKKKYRVLIWTETGDSAIGFQQDFEDQKEAIECFLLLSLKDSSVEYHSKERPYKDLLELDQAKNGDITSGRSLAFEVL